MPLTDAERTSCNSIIRYCRPRADALVAMVRHFDAETATDEDRANHTMWEFLDKASCHAHVALLHDSSFVAADALAYAKDAGMMDKDFDARTISVEEARALRHTVGEHLQASFDIVSRMIENNGYQEDLQRLTEKIMDARWACCTALSGK